MRMSRAHLSPTADVVSSSTRLRVGHVVPGYLPARGGVETLIDGVIPVLQESYGIESIVIAPRSLDERPQRFTHGGYEVVSVDMPHRYSPEAVTRRGARLMSACRRVIETLDLDLLHVHGVWNLFVPMTMVGRAKGLPVLHHVHGELLSQTRETHRETLRRSDWVVAVSAPVARSIASVAGRTNPVDVVPNGIPSTPLVAVSDGAPRLCLVGRLEGPKGFHHGLRAFARLVEFYPNLEMSIVGVGEDLIALQVIASRLGIARRVTFHGRIDRNATIEIMARCAVIVVPSLSTEGFSMVAAEAALLEKPVVSYRVGGLVETVQDGVSGTLVETGDVDGLAEAISAYLRDPALCRRHGVAARSRALSLYGLERFASDLARRYDTIRTHHREESH